MSVSRIKKAAARSAARQALRKEGSPPPPDRFPPGEIKKTSRGTMYRITTISLADLPAFLEAKELDPKTYFYFAPEKDNVLGVRKKGEKETREL